MTTYDKTKPLGSEAAALLDDRTRDNFAAIEERFSKEHHFPDNVNITRQGRHMFGVGTTAQRDAAFPTPYAGAFWGFNTTVSSAQIHDGSNWRDLTPPTELFVGEIRMWGGNRFFPPAGWLECRGQEVSRVTYAALFTAIGSGAWFGNGNGVDTFNLPDLRQRNPVGIDGGAPDYDVAGNLHPTPSHTRVLSIGNLPPHDHGGSTGGQVGMTANAVRGSVEVGPGAQNENATDPGTNAHTHPISSQGSGTPLDIRDQYIALVFLIWTGVP